MDALRVREGQEATISVDAMRGTTLSGRVASVSPVARTQQGIVSYPITVDINLSSALASARQGAATGAAGARGLPGQQAGQGSQADQGGPGGRLRASVTPLPDGRIVLPNGQVVSPDQFPGGQSPRGAGQTGREVAGGASATQAAADLVGSVLREGMTATVSVVQTSVTDVVVVPSRAVKGAGANAQVEVSLENGKTEMRTVEVGLSDGTRTEIRSGLTENDKVVVRTAARAAPTTQPAAFGIPGVGGGGNPGRIIGGR